MKKVYCCDCAYYRDTGYAPSDFTSQRYYIQEECLSPKNTPKEYDSYKCSMAIKSSPSELNRGNSCIYFERKK